MRIHIHLIWLGLTLAAASLGCATMQGDPGVTGDCVVATVVDGDTFRCQDGRRVRLVGVDSPEYQQRPYGDRARTALLQLLPPGARVRLELDVAPHDPYGRVLAYVWSGTDLINERMVHEGWSVLYTVPPNVKYAARLGQAQKEARVNGAGLWAEHGFECLPGDFRRRRCVSRP
ncbi:MAG TPA: thermonuclease family protein [Gemmatimonadales bacterium]|nr:thermonuclease family protein [Gemmatimonadales bacterium]